MSWFFKSEEEYHKNRILANEQYRLGWKNGIEAFEALEIYVDTWLLKIAGKTESYIAGYIRGHQAAASLRLYAEDEVLITKEALVDFPAIIPHLPDDNTQATLAASPANGVWEVEFAGKLEGLDRPLITFLCSEALAKAMRRLYLKENPL